MQKLISFLTDESGASAAEYALILAIIGAGVGVAVFALGGAITGKVTMAKNCIESTTQAQAQTNCGTAAAPAAPAAP